MVFWRWSRASGSGGDFSISSGPTGGVVNPRGRWWHKGLFAFKEIPEGGRAAASRALAGVGSERVLHSVYDFMFGRESSGF